MRLRIDNQPGAAGARQDVAGVKIGRQQSRFHPVPNQAPQFGKTLLGRGEVAA
jgi:hypothetical protein